MKSSLREGESAFTLAPFTGFVAELRLLQSMDSGEVSWIVCSLHGLVQGGGLAMSQIADFRVADSETSYVLGNLSRGAVPCMLLSGLLPLRFSSLAEAMAFYLEDTILDMSRALSLDLVQEVLSSVSRSKEAAFRAASEILPAAAWRRLALRPLIDIHRFAQESYALQLSLKCGEAFQVDRERQLPAPNSSERRRLERRTKDSVHRKVGQRSEGLEGAERVEPWRSLPSVHLTLPRRVVEILAEVSRNRWNVPRPRPDQTTRPKEVQARSWSVVFRDLEVLQRLLDLFRTKESFPMGSTVCELARSKIHQVHFRSTSIKKLTSGHQFQEIHAAKDTPDQDSLMLHSVTSICTRWNLAQACALA